MKTTSIQTLAWFGGVMAALVLASAAPNESTVMGKLPSLTAKKLDQGTVNLPEGLPAGRTLALVAFHKGHRGEIDSWIDGLNLRQDASIAWVRMPVLDDPGTEKARADIESRLHARHVTSLDRDRLLPVFTNRDAFLRSTGMSNTDHAWVLVIGRDGQVLAKVQGHYHHDKAQALRETLVASNSLVF